MFSYRIALLTFFLIATVKISYSQVYEVIQVRGKVMPRQAATPLIRGSKYLYKDTLKFSHISNRIAVINGKKEAFIVYPKLKNSTLVAQYHPVPFKTNGRPGGITSTIGLIQHINEKETYPIIGEICQIDLGKNAFPLNQDTFFYITYKFENERINKRLAACDNILIIDKKTLLQADYQAHEKYKIDTTVQIPIERITGFEIGYYDSKNKRPIPILDRSQPDALQQRITIPIQLVFLREKELLSDICFLNSTFRDFYPAYSAERTFERIHAHLENVYGGKIEEMDLRILTKHLFPIPK